MAALYELTKLSDGSGEFISDFAGEALSKHALVYRDASNLWRLADADDASKMPILGITLEAIGSGLKGRVMLNGYVADTAWSWAVGSANAVIYASGTPGGLTQTPPALVRVVGTAYSATSIMFNPSGVSGLGGNDPETEADYIIWNDGANYYAKNGHSGAIEFTGASVAAVIALIIAAYPTFSGVIYDKTTGYISGYVSGTRHRYEPAREHIGYPASYVIWVEGGTYYAKNGHTGQVTSGINFATLTQGFSDLLNKIIFLKPGIYTVDFSDKLTIKTGVKVIGSGANNTKIKASGSVPTPIGDYLIQINGEDAGLYDLTVDFNGDALTYGAYNANSWAGAIIIGDNLAPPTEAISSRIKNVKVINAKKTVPVANLSILGLNFLSGKYSMVEDIIFEDCDTGLFIGVYTGKESKYSIHRIKCIDTTTNAVYFEEGNGVVINDVLITGGGDFYAPAGGTGITESFIDNVRIYGTGKLYGGSGGSIGIVDSVFQNIYVDSSSSYGVNLAKLSSTKLINIINYNSTQAGFYCGGQANFINCESTYSQTGFLSNSALDKFYLVNFKANYNDEHGYSLTDGRYYLGNCEGKNNDQGNSGKYGCYLNSDYSQIIGGFYGDDQGVGTQNYGIVESGDYNTISETTVIGNTAEQISFIGAFGANSKIHDNIGYVTENSGTATLLSGQNHVHVTHGLSYTPTAADITITFTEQPTNATTYWYVGSITNLEFQLFANDPGASNLDFSWAARKTP